MEKPKPVSLHPDLINKLDAANRRFHDAKQKLKQTMANSEDRHQERIDKKPRN